MALLWHWSQWLVQSQQHRGSRRSGLARGMEWRRMARWWMGMGWRVWLARRLGLGPRVGMLGLRLGIWFWLGSGLEPVLVLAFLLV